MDVFLLLLNFFHVAGIIIMVGSVAIIDAFGFVARNSKKWTLNTIEAHHVTKPMIWIGAVTTTITWIMLLFVVDFDLIAKLKTIIIPLLLLNGSFLSFYISPRLDKQRGKMKLLPAKMKRMVAVSFVVSLILNWSFVFLTVWMLTR